MKQTDSDRVGAVFGRLLIRLQLVILVADVHPFIFHYHLPTADNSMKPHCHRHNTAGVLSEADLISFLMQYHYQLNREKHCAWTIAEGVVAWLCRFTSSFNIVVTVDS